MTLLRIIVVTLAVALAAPVAAQDKGTTNMEILREKLKADKKLVVAANMGLTEAEGKAFWPLYDAYQKDLEQINDRLAKTIVAYADAYKKGPVPNETAKKLLDEALAVEEAEVALKRSYVPKLEKAVPAAKVARYIQIENKIRAVVRYELADKIPLVK
jgi:cob(I)alamin adenosyltransferase